MTVATHRRDTHYMETNEVNDKLRAMALEHSNTEGHTTSFRPGHGWVCQECDGSDAMDDLWSDNQ